MGHKKDECLRLMSGVVEAPALDTLRIIDSREGRVDAPIVRGRAFQLHAEETQVPSDVVTSIYHIHLLHAFITCDYDHVIICEALCSI